MLIVFTVLVKKIEKQRYLDNDKLTKQQEKQLQSDPRIIVEDYGDGQRTYALAGYNYK